ncbi:MAG: hypothetical protein SOV90_11825 [Lachnospiraceae bacterium]|nr:hypothetical protein [Clostridiales bacterium]MDD6292766.1 hypothetical protein [Eubacteriales bacterium]MDY2608584.1 hypothetical protein [Lachnospiraceae bacterium]
MKNVKKKICILLTFCIMISVCACGGSKKKESTKSEKSNKSDLSDLLLSGKTKNNKKSEESTKSTTETTTEKDDNVVKIDPFKNLKVTFLGASPFLRVNIDTSQCDEVQQYYVRYDYEDKNYKIGDKVTIEAILQQSYTDTGTDEYELKSTSKEYEVESTAEWLTSLDGIDMTELNKEVEDKLASSTTETVGDWKFGGEYLGAEITSIGQGSLRAKYFITLKSNQYEGFDSLSNYSDFNYYICIYDYDIGLDSSNKSMSTVTCCVILSNIKKDTDGTLKYDTALDFTAEADNYDKIVNDCVTSKRDNYNVTDVTETAQ